ncbi:MAG: hypothetical protein J6A75_06050 [Lachnospiraceae bacterium]|nr:hypothetical protein [Lachnospiraceae bacterium]
MSKKVYRMCLIMAIMAAALSGFFYYQYSKNQDIDPENGTFVQKDLNNGEEAV